jgi:hypothetical protein
MRFLHALPAVLFVLAGPSTASADPALVENLIREGVELRKQGKDQLALPLFKRAYDIERSPRTAAQLGLGEASLGYWLAAERHLVEALTATRNPWLGRHESELRKTLRQVRLSIGELVITGRPAGAEVLVNGQPAGRLPLANPVRVPEGAAQVMLRAPGYAEASTNATVEGGKRETVTLELERPAAPVAPATAEPALVVKPSAPRGEPTGDLTVAARPRPPASWVRPLSWVAATASVAALGVGTYSLLTQRARGKQFDEYVAPGSTMRTCGVKDPGKGGTRCADLYNQQQAAKRLVMPGFVAGARLAAGAVVGFAMAAQPDEGGAREVAFDLQLGDFRSSGASLVAGWARAF